MLKEKKSFFERLAGSITVEEDELETQFEDEVYETPKQKTLDTKTSRKIKQEEPIHAQNFVDDEEEVGELSVDVYQTPNEIIVEAMVAGVKPEDLHLSITRDMVTIKGRRDGNTQVSDDDYFYKELYWGAFSRSILLPHEVEIEEAEAIEKHGLLVIRMPKIDKARQTKLRVKSI